MNKTTRNGSLLLVLAVICAVTLMWSPVSTHAAGNDGQTSWTDESPGGGTNTGDPDQPTPGMSPKYWVKSGQTVTYTPRRLPETSITMSSVSMRSWMQQLVTLLQFRLGWY